MNPPEARTSIIHRLLDKGVRIPCPESVDIGPEISHDRISGKGVTIHAGCRLFGKKTVILPDARLGEEGPVTIRDCQIGEGVRLKGGSFQDATFLKEAGMGPGAQIREGCLLEEGARGAHTVGLKQTILFPFVTLGSLINFCDCLMAGGTGPKDHSEVGSSFIHFNYTPNQDKATASLIGDVPRGVMLNQHPIFLGGQGGLVGPVRVAYGVVTAAGSIVRKDLKKPDVLVLDHPSINKSIPFQHGLYNNVKRIVMQNTVYIANLIALRRWYMDIRSLFLTGDPLSRALHEGALDKLQRGIRERVKRLGEVAGGMERSIEIIRRMSGTRNSKRIIKNQEALTRHWDEMAAAFEEALSREGDFEKRNPFIDMLSNRMGTDGKDYLTAIRALDEREAETGTSWLQGLVDGICRDVWACVPEMEIDHG